MDSLSPNPCLKIGDKSSEIRELRYLRDGILIRGKSVSESVPLKHELERFDELRAEVESLAETAAKQVESANSTTTLLAAVVIINLIVMYLAFTLDNGPAAIFFCVTEAVILLACCVWIWRSKMVPRRLKRMSLVALIPIMSLVARAFSFLDAM